MAITPPKDFIAGIEAKLRRFNEATEYTLIQELMIIGEKAVNEARQHHAYKDQTGNLTSSIGYAIFKDGELVYISQFNQRYKSKKKNNEVGTAEGENYALSLASQFPQGITLVVVAGMNYAAYVERKGIGGMTGAELKATTEIEKILKRMTKEAYRFEEKMGKQIGKYIRDSSKKQ